MSVKQFRAIIFGAAALGLAVVFGFSMVRPAAGQLPTVVVYKDANCGCCSDWIDHLEEEGFTVEAHNVASLADVKIQHGITSDLGSCHTAVVDGYIVEGHVPADDVKRMLEERPAIAGIAVPGMPVGSPGMEGNYVERYQVVAFDRSGGRFVFANH